MRIQRGAVGTALSILFAFAAQPALAQYVSLVGGTPPVQDFGTLAATGTSDALPDGWTLFESDDNANTTYAADNGGANSGNTYSYGATGSGERAFGMLQSGSLVPLIGAQLRNDTALVLGEIAVSYTGEQWRLGVAGRSDRLDFQYSLDATSLGGTGTWVDVDALDFTTPNTGAAPGALDGNAPANRGAVSGSITGLALAPSATLWVRWVDVNVSGIDDGLAIDDVAFAVAGDPPVDNPPVVVSTTPANGATGVALDASLAVSFSEPVTTNGSWFTLTCTDSGAHAATVSGGPTSYTLTPSPAFAADESCTWTIIAANITDNDGTPDHPAADTVVVFQTRDPATTPPTVVSITPADGATNVPPASDIGVVFSEPVTTATGAFSLACDAAPIDLIETGGGAQRTLTPATLLAQGADCSFTILASAVTNAWDVPLAANVTISFEIGAGTGAYYDAVNTASPDQLRCSLHRTIRGHTAYPYSGSGTNTWTILELAQANPSNPNQIIDVYRNRLYTAVSDRAGTGSGITYNREHTWPNSLGFPSQTGNLGLPNAPYTDTHMLWLSDTQYNSDRGNKPFANCDSGCGERPTEANGGVGGGGGGDSNWVRSPDGNQGSFESWDHRKGEMARAIFYMAIRYEGGVDPVSGQNEPQLELTDLSAQIVGMNDYTQTAYMGLLADLLDWHLADPPDADEIARNDLIQTFQGNRNPFVDHPEWATRALFESSNPPVCELPDNDSIFADGFE